MKKICVIAIIWIMCLTVALSGCRKESASPSPFEGEIALDGNVLVWQAQDGAVSYGVRVIYDAYNGYEVPVDGTRYPLTLYQEGQYVLSVRALTADGYTAYSAPLTYTVEKDVVVTPTDEDGVVLRGDGSKDDPLLIYTAKELKTIKSGKTSTEDGDSRQLYYRLMSDIDLEGEEWTPIGDHAAPFEGIFDGNGHTIAHWVQTKAYDVSSYLNNGLFGIVRNATIVNLTVADFLINPGVVSYTIDIGGLAGSANNTIIENCTVNGSIVVARTLDNTEKVRAGMILGHAAQASVATRIERCQAYGSINVKYGRVYAGGIVGVTAANRTHLLNNYADVEITVFGTAVAKSSLTSAMAFGGQLVGFISSAGDVDGNVGVGRVTAGARDGTPTDNIGKGVMGGTYHVSTSTTSGIKFTNIYFDYTALGVALGDPFDTEAEIAQHYAVGGGVTKQNGGSTVYALTKAQMGDPQLVTGLDMDVWEIADGVLRLRDYRSEFFTVTYRVGEEIVGTQVVLKGQPATCPFTYEGEQAFLAWDYDDSAIAQDTTINAILRQGE